MVLVLPLWVCSDLFQSLLQLMDMDLSLIMLEVLLRCLSFQVPLETELMLLMLLETQPLLSEKDSPLDQLDSSDLLFSVLSSQEFKEHLLISFFQLNLLDFFS